MESEVKKMVTFNSYINRIGIEFEGFYTTGFYSLLSNYPLVRIGSDGSLSQDDHSMSLNMHTLEVRTTPLNERELNEVLTVYNSAFIKDEYYINSTCGLHFHISVPDSLYGRICTPEFYDDFIKRFSITFTDVFRERAIKHHCRADLKRNYGFDMKSHFSRSSANRYQFINYSYRKHKTFEIRGYGGSQATIKELAQCIQLVVDMVREYAETEKVVASYSKKLNTTKKTKLITKTMSKEDIDGIFSKSYYKNTRYPKTWNQTRDIIIPHKWIPTGLMYGITGRFGIARPIVPLGKYNGLDSNRIAILHDKNESQFERDRLGFLYNKRRDQERRYELKKIMLDSFAYEDNS